MLAPAARAPGGRTATVRVLDFGGDKVPPFLRGEPRRGIELLLAHPGAFRAQLAAIARAGGRARDAAADPARARRGGRRALTRAMLPAPAPRLSLGAMIELPEAAAAAREIAAECDFLSVGTNDLTHATLGTDRFAHGEAPAHDPRVLRNIAAAAAAAAGGRHPARGVRRGRLRPADRAAAGGAGRGRAERGRARVGTVRAWIRALDYGQARELAHEALDAPDAAARRAAGSAARADQLRVATRSRMAARAASASSPGRRQAELRPGLRSQGEHRQKALRVGLALARGHLDARREAHRGPHEVGRRSGVEVHAGGQRDDDRLRACLRHARPPPTGRHRRAACPRTRSPPRRPRPRRSARPTSRTWPLPCRSST